MWFISDTHFGHANFLNFKDDSGKQIRPFSSTEEMDEHMVEQWNKTIMPGNKVYHLGDVCFGDPSILTRLNGSKRLIVGNHDNLKDHRLLAAFKKVSLWRLFRDFDFYVTHVPMREDTFHGKVRFNLHGHIHEKDSPTQFHMNMSVEKINYTPVHIDEIVKLLKVRKEGLNV